MQQSNLLSPFSLWVSLTIPLFLHRLTAALRYNPGKPVRHVPFFFSSFPLFQRSRLPSTQFRKRPYVRGKVPSHNPLLFPFFFFSTTYNTEFSGDRKRVDTGLRPPFSFPLPFPEMRAGEVRPLDGAGCCGTWRLPPFFLFLLWREHVCGSKPYHRQSRFSFPPPPFFLYVEQSIHAGGV